MGSKFWDHGFHVPFFFSISKMWLCLTEGNLGKLNINPVSWQSLTQALSFLIPSGCRWLAWRLGHFQASSISTALKNGKIGRNGSICFLCLWSVALIGMLSWEIFRRSSVRVPSTPYFLPAKRRHQMPTQIAVRIPYLGARFTLIYPMENPAKRWTQWTGVADPS